MDKINNPHDKFFKETFGDLNVTTNFIEHYLPKEISGIIDVNSITPLKDSFIQKELSESYSDLLFRVNIDQKEGYLYFLFEHKSYQYHQIAFQLLGYMQQIWNQTLLKEKAETVPIIIPLVFYHGKRKWTNVRKIDDWIKGYESFSGAIQKYVPSFDFVLFDFSLFRDKSVKGNPKLKAFLNLSKHIFVTEIETFLMITASIEYTLSQYDRSFLDTVLLYILSARDDLSVEKLKDQLTIEGGRRLMSLAERLRDEGKELGKKLGKELGELNKARQMTKKLFQLGMDEKQIIEVTELSAKEVAQIKSEL